MTITDNITKICYEFERIEKMRVFLGYFIGSVISTTTLLYLLDKRGIINV